MTNEPQLPRRPEKPTEPQSILKYYKANAETIAHQVIAYGKEAVVRHWELSAKAYERDVEPLVKRLRKGDTLPGKEAPQRKRQPVVQALRTSVMTRLPDFPEFSNAWDPSVQLAWINTYSQMLLHNRQN